MQTVGQIIPQPVSYTAGKDFFNVPSVLTIAVEDASLKSVADVFVSDMQLLNAVRISEQNPSVFLHLDKGLAEGEYVIDIAKRQVNVSGGAPEAVHYAMQSLKQLLMQGHIQCGVIKDKPFFHYRGAHLDVARHFFTVDEVKKFIDIMSLHKLNKMHWHLTDDTGWRIEIRKYPELTKIGSYRKQTIVGFHKSSNTFDGVPHSGYYTQDEIRDIVKYAKDRFIEIIPEIDMPGHSLAALASYPWLGCIGGPYEVLTKWGISDDILCAGKETTFEFVENVLSEIIELFPSEYIHIGGDECPKTKWDNCKYCRQRMKDNGLRTADALHGYFVKRLEKWLLQHDRKIIGWDETLYCGVSANTVIMSWRDAKHGIEAIKRGHNVIMTPVKHCYLDYYQTADPEANGEALAFPRYLPVKQVYRIEPYDQLTPDQQKKILGIQCCLWTEFISDMKHVEWMLLPRLAAIADNAWAYDRKSYSVFEKNMGQLKAIYDKLGYNYAPFMFLGIE